jgi:ubiquinone/menaquinone biosynthesis C-methylase UbiE
MTHLEHLEQFAGALAGKKIVDLGSGRGGFLIAAAKQGLNVVGLEVNPAYITETFARAKSEGVQVRVEEGVAEKLPFPDDSFDFANVSEVIEHVQDPDMMLKELHRVLVRGGMAYLSVPNRFGMKDQHFHLYFVNWLPRAWSDGFISLFGNHKNYDANEAGYQRLRDMHYYTFSAITKLVRSQGFEVRDIRLMRIRKMPAAKRLLASIVYPLARVLYFDAFHLALTKESGQNV